MQSTNAEFSHAVIPSSVRLVLPSFGQHEAGTSWPASVCAEVHGGINCAELHTLSCCPYANHAVEFEVPTGRPGAARIYSTRSSYQRGNVYAILDLPERSVARPRARPGRRR